MNEVVDNKVEETKQNVQENNLNASEKKNPETGAETPEQINWKKFREAREQERKAKEQSDRDLAKKTEEATALKAAMDALLNRQQSQPSQSSNEDESDEDRLQKRIDEALAKRDRQYAEEKKQVEQREFPQRLASTFSDFDQVCSAENLDYLEYHYPEVAAPYKHLPDGFDKWASVYKAVKRFVPNPSSKKDQNSAEKNFNKPQSMAVSGTTQTTDSAPMNLDDKRRQDNWSRMQRVMKGGNR